MSPLQDYSTFHKALDLGMAALKEAGRLTSINPDAARVQADIAAAAARLAEAAK